MGRKNKPIKKPTTEVFWTLAKQLSFAFHADIPLGYTAKVHIS